MTLVITRRWHTRARRRPGSLVQKVNRHRGTEHFDYAALEQIASHTQIECLPIERDSRLQVGHVKIEQQLHVRAA